MTTPSQFVTAVDTALQHREAAGQPIRVGLVGAGSTGRAIALQLGTPVAGIRLVAIANRTLEHGERAFREAGVSEWKRAGSVAELESAIGKGLPALTEDPVSLTACDAVDIIVEVTGTVDAAANLALAAFRNGKHLVLVNAELDSLLGPILKAKADQSGVVVSHTDGDEPGVAMTLLRYVRSLGLKPVAAGNIKGMVDHYRTPTTQAAFAEKNDQDPRKVTSFADATKLSMEATVLANATGFHVARRGMIGPRCGYVREIAQLLPSDQMLATGIVDYALGAAPHTGAFVIVHEDAPLKKVQLAYYKLGDGPFYAFYTPFHLPHIQIASTIGRAVLHRDATVSPIGRPVCEVVTVAKRDIKAGETLDGIGGFCCYGLVDNAAEAREQNALPISLSEGCKLRRGMRKDALLSFSDVDLPPEGIALALWREQQMLWPSANASVNKDAFSNSMQPVGRISS